MRPADEIERLLTGLRDRTSTAFDQRTLSEMFSALETSIGGTPVRSWRGTGRAIMQSRITQLAAAAVLLLAVLLLARHLTGRETPAAPGDRSNPIVQMSDNQEVPARAAATQEQKLAQLAQELNSAKELFAAADTKGLLHLLETGQDQTKIAAANYLARMGEEAALPALQRLADQWQGPGDDNPFRKSIDQIRNGVVEKDGTTPQTQPQKQVKPGSVSAATDDARVIVFVTQKATGEPIPQAKIEVQIGAELKTYAADGKGAFILDLGTSIPDSFSISAFHQGYVLQGVTLRDLTQETLPRTVRFSLDEGVIIGALVQDSEGNPIEDAIVEADYWSQGQPDEPWFGVRIEERTDAQGRWRASNVPQEIGSLGFKVSHPDYAVGSFEVPAELRFDDLRAERAVMTLDKGVALAGRVVDIAGRPIVGAKLLLGQLDPSGSWAQADAQGRFEFPHVRTFFPFLLLTVQTPGFTPQRRVLPVQEISTPVDFVLKPAQPLIGRVVDSAGRPIEDAHVTAQKWEGTHTLQWASRTDAQGMFSWDYPPDNGVVIHITKAGYREFRRRVFVGSRERAFVLGEPATIRGTVVDAGTKEPVKRFRVTPGIWNPESSRDSVWQPADTCGKWFADGQYRFIFDSDSPIYAVRVEADGYLPFESRYVDANEVETVIDVALTAGQGPSGYVFDANGTAVAGVEVVWGEIPEGRIGLGANRADAVCATTDDRGHFSFRPASNREPFVVFCDRGRATVSYEDLIRNGRIALTPWARVQGDLYVGAKPAVNRRIDLMHRLSGATGMTYSTHTDETGWFVFKRVYPGEFTLFDQTYEVSPGQTLELHLGGTGRTVEGELAMPEASDIPIRIDLILVPPSDRPSEELPWLVGHEQMSFAELDEWFTQFLRSPEGKAHSAGRQETSKVHHLELDGNRRFRADNVEPGTHILLGEIYRSQGSGEAIGRVWHELEVPPFTNVADLDVPLDLGALAVVCGELEPGDPAPDFDVPALGSGRVRLADHRGKVLLVSLFDMGSMRPDSKDLQDLKAIHQCFRSNPRYAQVSLQLAWIAPLDEKAVHEAHLEWPHGLIDECKDRVSTDYRLRRKDKSWNVLIGPQGQILAVGLAGKDLELAIEDALRAAR